MRAQEARHLGSSRVFLRHLMAFIGRDYDLTIRYFSWVFVFTFYAIVNSATIVLIGVAMGDLIQTKNLLLGAVLWSYLSTMFSEISNSITWERWEGTIEYTFMAPVSRLTHLLGVSAFAALFALFRIICVIAALSLMVDVDLSEVNLWGSLLIFLLTSISFMGLGLVVSILPLLSPERGPQGTHIIQGLILLVSGIYYPISVLPDWIYPLSLLSPATYALEACRKLTGIDPETLAARDVAGIQEILPEAGILLISGCLIIPLGLFIFSVAERYAMRTGRLKRSG